jgi:signal recognition particle subunit SRP54
MGDVLSLVEKAEATLDRKEAERLAKKVGTKKGMDLEDFLVAMRQMEKMGSLQSLMGMLPGVNKEMLRAAQNVDPKRMKHVEAIVLSMTAEERKNPDLINGSRRARISKGSGRPVPEINQMLQQFKQMGKMMKGLKGMGGMKAMQGMQGMMGPKGPKGVI